MDFTQLFIGMAMLQLIFVTYQYILFKRKEFLYYLLYGLAVTVFILFNAFPQFNPFPWLILTHQKFAPGRSVLFIGYAMYFRFGRYFTETPALYPRLNSQLITVERIFLAFAFIDIPLLLYGVDFYFLEPVSKTIYLIAMPYSMWVIFFLIMRRRKLTSILVIGSGLLLAFTSAGFIDALFITKYKLPPEHYLMYVELGIASEFLFLNYGLIYKTKMLQKEKMKLEIEQQVKLYQQRMRISSDLHDEIGATLSGIALYTQLTKTQMETHKTEDVERSLDRMQQSATEMVHKLSDIVWAVNPAKDSLTELWQKLDDYAREIASAKDVKVENETALSVPEIKLSMEERRNIYLLFKESINNAVKYSDCTLLRLTMTEKNGQLTFAVSDNGKGFDQTGAKKGNGLLFMGHRAKELNAQLIVESALNAGTTIQLTLKYPNEVEL